MSNANNDSLEPNQDSSANEESSALSNIPQAEAIEEIIEAIPTPEKREQARHIFEETFVGLIERSASNQINPEVARILADSADRDNDNKFKFLSQKQQDTAAAQQRKDELTAQKHKDRVSLIRPIIIFVFVMVILCLSVGIYLSVTGKETLGASLITGVLTAVLSYLAGVGTSDFFKDK